MLVIVFVGLDFFVISAVGEVRVVSARGTLGLLEEDKLQLLPAFVPSDETFLFDRTVLRDGIKSKFATCGRKQALPKFEAKLELRKLTARILFILNRSIDKGI